MEGCVKRKVIIHPRVIGPLWMVVITMAMVWSSSCVSEKGQKGRPLIKKFGSTDDTTTLCTQIYNLANFSCQSACRTGTHLASEQEKQEAITELNQELNNGNITSEQHKNILDNINSAQGGICVQGSGILRPSGAVFVKSDFCACKNGKPDIVNSCDTFCSSKSGTSSTLYGSVTLGPEIELNNELGNLERWCNAEITGSDFTAPGCFLQVYDGSSTQSLPITIPANGNSFTVNIESLNYKKVYVATIVESQSGSNAKSSSFQIYKKEPDTSTVQGPLKIMPVSQYTCITRLATENSGNFTFEKEARIHFYFASNATPPSLPAGIQTTVCHDINTHGRDDSPLYPRLELIPQHFALWDQSDIRFVDLDNDGRPDINQEIETRLRQEAGITRSLNTFNLLNWPNMPTVDGLNQVENPNVGFFMLPWINPQSGRAYCPGQDDYNGPDPIFQILKEVVGVDTEGIFFAESEPVTQSPGSFTQDVIIIREGLLKKIWFYYENNQHFVPDEVTSASKTTRFYWPADTNDPYVRKSTQKIYTVRYPTDIGKEGATQGLNNTIRPPDKRFGCAPALD